MSHLSEGSSSNHLQDLKVLLVQPHLLHFGGERFGCRQKDRRAIKIQLKTAKTIIYPPFRRPLRFGELSLVESALQASHRSHPLFEVNQISRKKKHQIHL